MQGVFHVRHLLMYFNELVKAGLTPAVTGMLRLYLRSNMRQTSCVTVQSSARRCSTDADVNHGARRLTVVDQWPRVFGSQWM